MAYYTLITDKGKAALVKSSSTGDKLNLTHIAAGDGKGGEYEPTEAATALKGEVWRGPVARISPHDDDPAWLVIETVIPQSAGSFTVREVGVYDSDGALFAIGKYPETYKPQISDGAGKELLLRIILQVSNAASVNLTLSSRAVATHRFVTDKVIEHNTDLLAHANLAVPDASTETKGKVELATYDEVYAGTDEFRAVTPYGLKWALPALMPDADTSIKGKVELATSAETTTGTDAVRAVTPAGLKAALPILVPDAGTETKGRVELATGTETTTGTDAVRAVTPAGLKAALPTLVPDAGTETKGKVELATSAETTTGTDAERAVTPAGLKSALPTLVPSASTLTKGKVELATGTETSTGTDAVRAVTPAGLRYALPKMAKEEAFDIPFMAGFSSLTMEPEDLEVRTYGIMVAARNFQIVGATALLHSQARDTTFDVIVKRGVDDNRSADHTSIFNETKPTFNNATTPSDISIDGRNDGRVSAGNVIIFKVISVYATKPGKGLLLGLKGKVV